MSDEVLEEYIRQTIEAHCIPEVTFAWQGGEPTLMGRDFFEKAMVLQKHYCRPGMVIQSRPAGLNSRPAATKTIGAVTRVPSIRWETREMRNTMDAKAMIKRRTNSVIWSPAGLYKHILFW